jgi:hypothetical protein
MTAAHKTTVHTENVFALLGLKIVIYRSFEVFMTATHQTGVFLTVTWCKLVGTYQHSAEHAVTSLKVEECRLRNWLYYIGWLEGQ